MELVTKHHFGEDHGAVDSNSVKKNHTGHGLNTLKTIISREDEEEDDSFEEDNITEEDEALEQSPEKVVV